MSQTRLVLLTGLAMIAFAGNSLLCRMALKYSAIDPATFTAIRLLSGALTLGIIVLVRGSALRSAGNWRSALALFAYAACFSFAYVSLPAAVGALLLFGAVQATMIGYGLSQGERLQGRALLGFLVALGGLLALLWPGLAAPPLVGATLMSGAGIAWGVYSLRGKGVRDPLTVTAGNFWRAALFGGVLGAAMLPLASFDPVGVGYAIASGAVASGLGYAIWYTALPALKATSAATVQLSVPVIAALGGIVFLGEALTLRLLLAAPAILGGIALVITDASARR